MSKLAEATIVFFDRDDVLNAPRFVGISGAVALSPSAVDAAQDKGILMRDSAASFSDVGHARCVAAARRALREFDKAVRQIDLAPSINLMAKQSLWGHACLVHRLRWTLPPGPWVVRNCSGQWIEAKDWQALQQAILPRIWNYGLAHRIKAGRPPLTALYRGLNRVSALLSSKRPERWVVAPSRKLKNALHEALLDAGAGMAVFQPCAGGWADYASLMRRVSAGDRVQTFLVAPLSDGDTRVQRTLASLRQVAQFISDARVRSAWTLYEPYFSRTVPTMLAMVDEGATLMRALRVHSAVTYEANSWLSAALMEAAGTADAVRAVFNHNSQPPCGSAIANSVLGTLFRHRTYNALTDVAALWSPAPQQWKEDGDMHGTTPQNIPVRLDYPRPTSTPEASRPLRILHAGNYQNWSDFFPWIAETADEYLNGVETLAATVERLDGMKLVIRVRPKREVDSKAVEARLGRRRNVTVCGTDQEFLEQLADSDLLVSHFSTTVEQALQMGKPVLLWGSAGRYRQFAGQESPPRGSVRAPVYAVRRAEDLPAMLAAIRDAHRGNPLRPEESSAYRFAPGTPGLTALAQQLIGVTPAVQTEVI